MRKFWSNNEELTAPEQRLVDALYAAHAVCVERENCSTMALIQAAGGSRSLTQSYIAALATLGEMHGPVEGTFEILNSPNYTNAATSIIFLHWKHPGWGNSFIKGKIDDAFIPVDQCLEQHFPRAFAKIREITEILHSRGKLIFPNPAAYTATVALVLGMPRHLAPMLFVQARLEAWTHVFHRTIEAMNQPKEKARVA
jgi:citrate synthase